MPEQPKAPAFTTVGIPALKKIVSMYHDADGNLIPYLDETGHAVQSLPDDKKIPEKWVKVDVVPVDRSIKEPDFDSATQKVVPVWTFTDKAATRTWEIQPLKDAELAHKQKELDCLSKKKECKDLIEKLRDGSASKDEVGKAVATLIELLLH